MKVQWKIATFGTDNDNFEAIHLDMSDIEIILQGFGPKLINLGRKIWEIHVSALEKAPFMTHTSSS